MRRNFYALFAAVALVAGCAVAGPSSIKTQVGEQFNISLLYNSGTGYQWQLAQQPDPALLKVTGPEYKAPTNNKPGAEGVQVWIFEAIAQGKTNLSFRYVRPWEKSAAPASVTNFSVVISEAKKEAK
jgi:predicted secreted protein